MKLLCGACAIAIAVCAAWLAREFSLMEDKLALLMADNLNLEEALLAARTISERCLVRYSIWFLYFTSRQVGHACYTAAPRKCINVPLTDSVMESNQAMMLLCDITPPGPLPIRMAHWKHTHHRTKRKISLPPMLRDGTWIR